MHYNIRYNGLDYVFSTQSQAWFDTVRNRTVPMCKWGELSAAARAAGIMPKVQKAERAEKSVKVSNVKQVNISKSRARRQAAEAITIFDINW